MLVENGAPPDELFTSKSITNDDNDPAYEDVDSLPDLSHEGGEYQEIAGAFSQLRFNKRYSFYDIDQFH